MTLVQKWASLVASGFLALAKTIFGVACDCLHCATSHIVIMMYSCIQRPHTQTARMPGSRSRRPLGLETATEQRKVAAATELANNDDLLAHVFLDTLLVKTKLTDNGATRNEDAIEASPGLLVKGARIGVHYHRPEYAAKELKHDPKEILNLLQSVCPCTLSCVRVVG